MVREKEFDEILKVVNKGFMGVWNEHYYYLINKVIWATKRHMGKKKKESFRQALRKESITDYKIKKKKIE
jgi:hypothetical protein